MPERDETPDTYNTRTNRLRREQYRKKLDRLLKAAEDAPFLDLVWATRMLQTGHDRVARRVITYPPEAATASLGDEHHLAVWDLETLVSERLALPPAPAPPPGQKRQRLITNQFSSIEQLVRLSRAVEDANIGILLRRMDVLEEMRRLSHRQFEWQRGYVNGPLIYRWSFLYGGPITKAAFAAKTGIEISEFIRLAMSLRTIFTQVPVWRPDAVIAGIGFSPAQVKAGLALLAEPLAQARGRATRFKGESWSATYRPSTLRGSPMIACLDGLYRAPLPDLIV